MSEATALPTEPQRTFLIISESPVSVKMRIRHYFSQLSLHSAASYDLHQDDQNCKNFDQISKEDSDLISSQVRQIIFSCSFKYSVTRWLDIFFNIWPFARTKNCHNSIKIGQIRSKSLLNPQKVAQDF